MAKPKRSVTVSAREKKIKHYRSQVKAAYYSAASDSPSMDFSFASGVSMTDALAADLNILRNRIRYELKNNAPAKGLTRVYANACISTGPTLCVESNNDLFNEKVEFAWSEWSRNCGYVRGESLAEILHVGVRQFFTCGEYFSLNKIELGSNGISLRVLQIKPDRISQPYFYKNNSVIEGIEFSNEGKPVAYHIYDDNKSIYVRETAENMRHVFYQESPEQVRGEPWLAAGLGDLHKRRRYDEARVAAAIVAAKFAIFITNNDPSINVSAEEILDPGIVELNDGLATILPPHCGIQSFSGSQPTNNAEEFRREMIANAGAGVGMSAASSNQDSKGNSFAGARYDDVGVGLEYEVVRSIICNRDLTPLAKTWLKEAVAIGEVPPMPNWYRFVWRFPLASRHTDPLKAANADKARIESGVDSYAQIWAEHGISKEQRRQEIMEEINWYRKQGLKHPLEKDSFENVKENEGGEDVQ